MKTQLLAALGTVALLAPAACTKDSNEKAKTEAPKAAAAVPDNPASINVKPVVEDQVSAVVDRHLAALGGADKWLAATSMAYTISGNEGDVAFSYKNVRKRPNMMRVEKVKGDETHVKTFDGKVAAVSKNGKLEVLEGEKAKGMADYAQFDDTLLTYRKTGKKVELKGVEDVDGKPAHVLVISSDGSTESRYIDQASNLEVKRVVSWKHGEKSGTKVMYFTDYKPVKGLMVNHGFISEKDGKKQVMKVSGIEFNESYDDKLFRQTEGDS